MQVDMLLEAVPYSAMRRSYEDGQKQEEVGRDLISRRIQSNPILWLANKRRLDVRARGAKTSGGGTRLGDGGRQVPLDLCNRPLCVNSSA